MNEEQRTAKRVGRPQRSADQMGQPQRAAKNEAEDAGVPMRVSRVKRVGRVGEPHWPGDQVGKLQRSTNESIGKVPIWVRFWVCEVPGWGRDEAVGVPTILPFGVVASPILLAVVAPTILRRVVAPTILRSSFGGIWGMVPGV